MIEAEHPILGEGLRVPRRREQAKVVWISAKGSVVGQRGALRVYANRLVSAEMEAGGAEGEYLSTESTGLDWHSSTRPILTRPHTLRVLQQSSFRPSAQQHAPSPPRQLLLLAQLCERMQLE